MGRFAWLFPAAILLACIVYMVLTGFQVPLTLTGLAMLGWLVMSLAGRWRVSERGGRRR
jgi:hypothetical protein